MTNSKRLTASHGPTNSISVIIPVHNEEELLKDAVEGFLRYCEKHVLDIELIICENGSTDDTRQILKSISDKRVKKLFVAERGLGAAYKAGIVAATKPIIYFTGIDFPFGYDNLVEPIPYLKDYDFVYSSKAHPKSVINAPFLRKIVSFVFRSLMKLILPIKVNDPQGCLTARSGALKHVTEYCDSKDAFFQTQTALYANLLGYAVVEIPVNYLNPRFGSKFSIRKDSPRILRQMLNERHYYREKLALNTERESKEIDEVV